MLPCEEFSHAFDNSNSFPDVLVQAYQLEMDFAVLLLFYIIFFICCVVVYLYWDSPVMTIGPLRLVRSMVSWVSLFIHATCKFSQNCNSSFSKVGFNSEIDIA